MDEAILSQQPDCTNKATPGGAQLPLTQDLEAMIGDGCDREGCKSFEAELSEELFAPKADEDEEKTAKNPLDDSQADVLPPPGPDDDLDGVQVPAAAAGGQDKVVEAQLGVDALGLTFDQLPPGNVQVSSVEQQGWADVAGVKVGDRLDYITVEQEEMRVAGLGGQEFRDAMARRPLQLRFLTPEIKFTDMQAVNMEEAMQDVANMDVKPLPKYDLVKMSDKALAGMPAPVKSGVKYSRNVKHVLAQSELSTPDFKAFVEELSVLVEELGEHKKSGDLACYHACMLKLPKGMFGFMTDEEVKAFWKWAPVPFDCKAGNMDFQFNVALLLENDPATPGNSRVRLIRHFYNLPNISRAQAVSLAGTEVCLIDWCAVDHMMRSDGQDKPQPRGAVAISGASQVALQIYLTSCVGGVTFQSKQIVKKAKGKGPQNIPENTDVKGLHKWLRESGDADVGDPSVFSEWYYQEMQDSQSPLRSLKALGMGKAEMSNIIVAHQTRGSKGAKEVLTWDLTLEHFDMERLPWLKAAADRVFADPTKGIAMFGPQKCGKTQFLKTIAFMVSQRAVDVKIQDEGDTRDLVPGFFVSNDKDNFPRGSRVKACRPQILDDPDLSYWRQSDWLAWLDLAAEGVSMSSRYENTCLNELMLRGLGSNEKPDYILDKLGEHKARPIKNKGIFLDLYETSKLSQMRMSTWYRDAETGERVPIMLTEDGERIVRERYGLPCPSPCASPSPSDAKKPSAAMQAKECFMDTCPPDDACALEVSPGTKKRLKEALLELDATSSGSGSASSSSTSTIHLPADTLAKLMAAGQMTKRARSLSFQSLSQDPASPNRRITGKKMGKDVF